jgi:hypothetical protein
MKTLLSLFALCSLTHASLATTISADTLLRQWGTYYGGSSSDGISSIAVDASGNIYVCGSTSSTNPNVIATTGSHQPNLAGGTDAFIVKFNSAGVRIWGTYYGGTQNEDASDIAVDHNGDIVVVGGTHSTTGIATAGAHQTTYGGGDSYMGDGFIVKLNSDGVSLWATYYGGSSHDVCPYVAIDNQNNIVIGGVTDSPNNIATPGAHQQTPGGSYDSFVAKFNPAGVRLWGGYYGGSSYDWNGMVAVDNSNNIILEGSTQGSVGVLSTQGSHQPNYGGGSFDLFIVKFNSSGVRQWGTYYGGTGGDYDGYGLSTDILNNIYCTGDADSPNAIATPGSHQSFFGGSRDGFLAKFDSNGVRQWGTYYGGSGVENIMHWQMTQPGINGLYIYGTTNSTNNISSPNAYQPNLAGGTDVFIVKFNSAGIRTWGTYYGGSGNDNGGGQTVTNDGTIYAVGGTSSTNVIGVGGFQSIYGGGTSDGFIAKFSNIVTDVKETGYGKPIQFTLAQNYPNPFNPTTTIRYDLPMSSHVKLTIFDPLGREVATLVDEEMKAGSYEVKWEAGNVASGVYFCRMQTDEFVATKKLLLLK